MSANVNLKSLTISGFRGFIDEQSFTFDSSPTLLLGENGSGKSSTLGAIEWCLYGDLSQIPQHRSKNQEDIQNPKSERLEVSLVFENKEGDFKFTRIRVPGKSTMTELSVELPGGEEIIGDDAEQQVFRLLHLSEDSFIRSVYLHQKSIRDLLTEEPSSRNEAMDRLLGLDGPKGLIEGIQGGLKRWKNESKRQQSEFVAIRGRIRGQMEEANNRVNIAESEAAEAGIDPNQIDFKHCKDMSKVIGGEINSLLDDAGLAQLDPPVITEMADVDMFTNWIRTSIRDARKSFPEAKELETLTKRKNKAEGHKTDYAGMFTRWQQSVISIDEFKEEYGDQDEIVKNQSDLSLKIEGLKTKRDSLNAKLRVIKDAVDYLYPYLASSSKKI